MISTILIYVTLELYDTHSFEWPYLLRLIWTKIVKQFVFLVQCIVFQHIFFNLWNNNTLISFLVHFLNSGIKYLICTQGPCKWGLNKATEKIPVNSVTILYILQPFPTTQIFNLWLVKWQMLAPPINIATKERQEPYEISPLQHLTRNISPLQHLTRNIPSATSYQ